MKKSFQKTLIAASVGAVMLAAAGTASANSLLFPYFTTATGAQSVLSVSANGSAASTFGASAERLHYVYNYGSACTHYDGAGAVTANDVMQHSVADPAYGGFGKVQAADASTPFYLPIANTTGFLTVTNTASVSALGSTTATITGDMAIIDPTTGLMVSYAGITNDTGLVEGDFSAGSSPTRTFGELQFELSYYPNNLVTTSFYAVNVGNMNHAIANGRDWVAKSSVSNGGTVWNNDERGYSGTQTKAITCSSVITPAELMNQAQTNGIGTNAGLIRATATPVTNTAQTNDVTSGLIVVKMQKILPAAGMGAGTQLLHRVPGIAAPV